jgi:preprotein translocase subunit Sec63
MATQLDYYGILQVHPGAEREVIDAAYRKLASKYHPDVSQISDAAERMKQINIAYEVLSDPVKRAAYDASLGMASPPDTAPYAAAGSQRSAKVRQTLLITAGLILLAVVVLKLAPSFMLLATRLVVPLVVIALVVWLIFTLAKSKR